MRSYSYYGYSPSYSTKSHTCPKCGSRELRRSPRRRLDRLISLVNLYPYRCVYYGCEHRFYRFGR